MTVPQEFTIFKTRTAGTNPGAGGRTWQQFLVQVFIAALVLVATGFYVWLVQKTYDKLDKEHSLFTPVCYASIILGAGLAYDFAKRVLLLPHIPFWSFVWNSAGGIACLSVMFVFLAICGEAVRIEAPLAAAIAYCVSLVAIWPTISLFSNALEVVGRNAVE